MPLVRVYLPLDAGALDTLRRTGEVGPAPVAGHTAVAPSARPGLGNDDEEREYAAWSAAATDAAALAQRGERRGVASADVDAAVVNATTEDGTTVELDSVVALPRIASFHIDEEPGGEVADLLWYDVTELDDVIRLVRGDEPTT
ncbi:hypothetical protein N798_16960 [Knoellia flava TL1]|uniref:Uncharacterized protein n=1 Tax=Knoellia flava TL1 TaxID=1385518 RepID=A0ABR4X9D9_9MICO|nr:hypothetical protein [Knoellia flava]KGN28743.1 hypothetical protein N798_16960 [Knoellia flava TL1]